MMMMVMMMMRPQNSIVGADMQRRSLAPSSGRWKTEIPFNFFIVTLGLILYQPVMKTSPCQHGLAMAAAKVEVIRDHRAAP